MRRADAVIMVEGTAALIEKLGIIEAERYLFNLKNTETFDYTEWRRENLWKEIPADEILAAAAEYDQQHKFSKNTSND